MDLLDLLKSTGGGDSIGKLADAVGLGSDDAGKLVASLGPAILGNLTKGAGDASGLSGLKRALDKGSHSRYIDNPESMLSDETREDGNKILGHILGSKNASRAVAAAAQNETGIDEGLIKKALPLLASLAMGAMSKKNAAPKEEGGGLGDLLGLARKFF